MRDIKLRNDFDITDEDFEKLTKPFDDELDSWFEKHRDIIEDFTAFYIAKGIKYNTLWNGSFIGLINGAVETLSSYFVGVNINRERLNTLLSEKYGIVVVKDNPMMFQKIKRSPANR